MRGVAVYLRVSSARQRIEGTIESQRLELLRCATARGLNVVEVYEDDGYSGVLPPEERPGLAKLLADASVSEKLFDAVLTTEQSRLSRGDLADVGLLYRRLRDAGILLMTPSGDRDLATPEGEMHAGLEALFARWEREKIKQRLSVGRRRASIEGRWPGGRPPTGLTWNKQARQWSVDPVWAPVVQRIFELYLSGVSTDGISTVFLAEGQKTPQECVGWSPKTIRTMLKNPAYKGEAIYSGVKIPVPALIEPERWERVQVELPLRKKYAKRNARREYLLRSLVLCGLCGSRLQGWNGTVRKTDGFRHTYYVCRRRNRPLPYEERCTLPYVDRPTLEEVVWREVEGLVLQSERVIAAMSETKVVDTSEQDVERWSNRILDIEGAITRVVRLVAKQTITDEEAKRTLPGLRGELLLCRTNLALVEERRALIRPHQGQQVMDVATAMCRLKDRLRNPATRREIIETMFRGSGSCITVFPGNKVIIRT